MSFFYIFGIGNLLKSIDNSEDKFYNKTIESMQNPQPEINTTPDNFIAKMQSVSTKLIAGVFILHFILFPIFMQANDKLPKVYDNKQNDKIANSLRSLAKEKATHLILPTTGSDLKEFTEQIRNNVIQASGALLNQKLPLNYTETRSIQKDGYTIKNISFQTRPGVYATANLYVPDGNGVFPAAIITHGHWDHGRRSELFQSVAHTLVSNGYVCLNMDAWGAGERTTIHEEHEYHGSNLGAFLMNVGETLLGMQVTDNSRGVDLLASFPFVDKNNIGATGASGGGNQAMWLAALDSRIKAVVPVVSIGTFQSYIMNSNCVCELLPNGMIFTEEAGILSLIAPRAMTIMNAKKELNPAFTVNQMLETYQQVKPIYQNLGAEDKLSYELFDTGHGYWPEMQEAMVRSFNKFLTKRSPEESVKINPFHFNNPELLATYPRGERPKTVITTAEFCQIKGEELHHALLGQAKINKSDKLEELKKLLHLDASSKISEVEEFPTESEWIPMVIKGSDQQEIPVLYYAPKGAKKQYTILLHPLGKEGVSTTLINQLKQEGQGIILPDLWGTGENSSPEAVKITGALPPFHTLSRSVLWLGNTTMGKWVSDLNLITQFLQEKHHAEGISIDASKETGLSALLFSTLSNAASSVTIRESPISYQFDTRAGVDFYNMAVHIPGILKWGDISLMAALSNSTLHFISPLTLSGRSLEPIEQAQTEHEFKKLRTLLSTNENSKISWIN